MFGIDDNPLNKIPSNVTEGGSQEVFDYLGRRLREVQGGPGGAGGPSQ